jgi:hypothetical protein
MPGRDVLDSGRLQFRIKIKIRAGRFGGVGGNCVVSRFSRPLPKPQIYRLTRKAGRGPMGPPGLSPQLSVSLVRKL